MDWLIVKIPLVVDEAVQGRKKNINNNVVLLYLFKIKTYHY